MVGFLDLGKRAKCLLRGGFQFSSFRVDSPPIASSRAMDARWNDRYRAARVADTDNSEATKSDGGAGWLIPTVCCAT